jgi:hypothetical protein
MAEQEKPAAQVRGPGGRYTTYGQAEEDFAETIDNLCKGLSGQRRTLAVTHYGCREALTEVSIFWNWCSEVLQHVQEIESADISDWWWSFTAACSFIGDPRLTPGDHPGSSRHAESFRLFATATRRLRGDYPRDIELGDVRGLSSVHKTVAQFVSDAHDICSRLLGSRGGCGALPSPIARRQLLLLVQTPTVKLANDALFEQIDRLVSEYDEACRIVSDQPVEKPVADSSDSPSPADPGEQVRVVLHWDKQWAWTVNDKAPSVKLTRTQTLNFVAACARDQVQHGEEGDGLSAGELSHAEDVRYRCTRARDCYRNLCDERSCRESPWLTELIQRRGENRGTRYRLAPGIQCRISEASPGFPRITLKLPPRST